MYIDRYIDNARELAQEEALREIEEAHQGLIEYYEELAQDHDQEEDISAQYEEHMLEIIGAV